MQNDEVQVGVIGYYYKRLAMGFVKPYFGGNNLHIRHETGEFFVPGNHMPEFSGNQTKLREGLMEPLVHPRIREPALRTCGREGRRRCLDQHRCVAVRA